MNNIFRKHRNNTRKSRKLKCKKKYSKKKCNNGGANNKNIHDIHEDNKLNILSNFGYHDCKKLSNINKYFHSSVKNAQKYGYCKKASFIEIVRSILELNPSLKEGRLIGSCEIIDKNRGTRKLIDVKTAKNDPSRVLGNINWNNLGITHLPENIGDLTIDGELDLGNNKLVSLPDNFSYISVRGDIVLNKNNLVSLPDNFGNLKTGGVLNLSYNNLHSLPKSFGNININGNIYLLGNKINTNITVINDINTKLKGKIIGLDTLYQRK